MKSRVPRTTLHLQILSFSSQATAAAVRTISTAPFNRRASAFSSHPVTTTSNPPRSIRMPSSCSKSPTRSRWKPRSRRPCVSNDATPASSSATSSIPFFTPAASRETPSFLAARIISRRLCVTSSAASPCLLNNCALILHTPRVHGSSPDITEVFELSPSPILWPIFGWRSFYNQVQQKRSRQRHAYSAHRQNLAQRQLDPLGQGADTRHEPRHPLRLIGL